MNYDVITFILKILILRRPGVAILATSSKLHPGLFLKIFKDSRKVNRIRNYAPKCNLILVFLDITKFADFQ